jgi:hypothetical protein
MKLQPTIAAFKTTKISNFEFEKKASVFVGGNFHAGI